LQFQGQNKAAAQMKRSAVRTGAGLGEAIPLKG